LVLLVRKHYFWCATHYRRARPLNLLSCIVLLSTSANALWRSRWILVKLSWNLFHIVQLLICLMHFFLSQIGDMEKYHDWKKLCCCFILFDLMAVNSSFFFFGLTYKLLQIVVQEEGWWTLVAKIYALRMHSSSACV